MVLFNRESTSSNDQCIFELLCAISSTLVVTPPALAAFPGKNINPDFKNNLVASGVDGLFAPSATYLTLLLISFLAESSSNSF